LRKRLGAVVALVGLTAAFAGSASAATDDRSATEQGPYLEVGGEPIPPSGGTAMLAAEAASPGTTFAGFNSVASPERLLDTRTGVGVAGVGPVGAGGVITVQFAGRGSVPADASAIVMNVTADAPTRGGYITVFPANQTRPGTSNINIVPNKTVPNLVMMPLNGGAASFYNAFGETHLIADVLGYARDDGHFVGFNPERFLDTRSGIGAPGAKVGARGVLNVDVLGWGSVPKDASKVGAVVVNITADAPTQPSFVTVWPSGVTMPNASSLNFAPNQTVANLVVAPVGSDGRISLYNESGETNLIGDIVGWIPSGAAYMPITPKRVLDTRQMTGPLGPDDTLLVDLSSVAPSPWTVGAYVLNVTAAAPTDTSFLTVYPAGQPVPNSSNLNTVPGENVPNAVMVRPGTSGAVAIRNERGSTHVMVDVVGIVPMQNALDTVDDAGGSRFHVVYVLGADSAPDPSMIANIRTELAAMNGWFQSETGTTIDFDRTGGQIDVTTWRMQNFTQEQILHWETTSGFPALGQLMQDGFGFPENHRFLVYVNGDRAASNASDGVCGISTAQYTTVFAKSACSPTGAPVSDPAAVGASANRAQVALHEMLHGLGAVPRCAPNYTTAGGGHVTGYDVGGADNAYDLMYPFAYSQPKHIDFGRNDYFRGDGAPCLDVARSPYMANVPG
jgi:hypothetical protein